MSEQVIYRIDDQQIVLLATPWFPERVLTTFTNNNKEATLGFLTDKFVELENEVKLLRAEYINAPDKVKLAGKINRTKQYIITAKAIGNYPALLGILDDIEKEIIAEIDNNIAKRLAILDEAKKLTTDTENWKASTEKLSQLNKDFKELALVPDPRLEEIKKEFDAIKDAFFDKKKGFYDEKDTILLDNLAHKMEICEKAVALANSKDWKKTTEAFNALTEEWKSVGQIPRHRSDELWEKFNGAKDVFFGNKKAHYEDVKVNQEESLVLKQAIIEKAKALQDNTDWKKTTELFNGLMEEWKSTGRLSNELNDKVWGEFNDIRNVFFKAKEAYYSNIRLGLEDNFAKKSVLVNRAETLSTEAVASWQDATDEMLEMMEEWKKIGRVAKEHGDELWERFIKAKKDFFAKKDADRAARKENYNTQKTERTYRAPQGGKLGRELQLEQDILADFETRLKNIVPGIRSFETQERYENIIEETKKKIEFLKEKIGDTSFRKSKRPAVDRVNNDRQRNSNFGSNNNNLSNKPKQEGGETDLGKKLLEDIKKLGGIFSDVKTSNKSKAPQENSKTNTVDATNKSTPETAPDTLTTPAIASAPINVVIDSTLTEAVIESPSQERPTEVKITEVIAESIPTNDSITESPVVEELPSAQLLEVADKDVLKAPDTNTQNLLTEDNGNNNEASA